MACSQCNHPFSQHSNVGCLLCTCSHAITEQKIKYVMRQYTMDRGTAIRWLFKIGE